MSLEEVLAEGSCLSSSLAMEIAQEIVQASVGRTQEARRILKLALARRFPGLEDAPEIDKIGNVNDLEALLLDYAIRTDDRGAMAQAIREAASKA